MGIRYIQRKKEQESAVAEHKAEKTIRIRQEMSDRESVFGDVIQPVSRAKKDTRTWSPRVTMGSDRDLEDGDRETGMGVKDEAMGNLTGGRGLKDVGMTTEEA